MSPNPPPEPTPEPTSPPAANRRPSLSRLFDTAHPGRVMGRLVRKATKEPGAPPGTLVHTGAKREERVRITLIDYDAEHSQERQVERIEDCFPFKETPTTTWVNVDGLHDVELIRRVGEEFGIHPLVLEDVLSVGQRPKIEEYEEYLFLVLHMLTFEGAAGAVHDEQISVIVGENWVFSFQERVGDVFDPVRERIRAGNSRIRARGVDYLAYALTDAVVDAYFGVLEGIGEVIEGIDSEVMGEPDQDTLHRIHRIKREMLVIRRAVWPLRDVLGHLLRSEHPRVAEETRVYLRDVYDHGVQVLDTVETLRDLASGLTDLYLSTVGQRTNEVMKVLTVIGSVFIPLTFVAGVYGMNFEYMPELTVRWAYPAILLLMAAMGGGMAWFFHRKGWI